MRLVGSGEWNWFRWCLVLGEGSSFILPKVLGSSVWKLVQEKAKAVLRTKSRLTNPRLE